ncbi:MAG: PAS domain-containing protein, partial [Verrucomicrobiota bacterium]
FASFICPESLGAWDKAQPGLRQKKNVSLDLLFPSQDHGEVRCNTNVVLRDTTRGNTHFYITLHSTQGDDFDRALRVLERATKLIDTMATHLWITDMDERLIHANERCAAFFGVPAGEEVGNLRMSLEIEAITKADPKDLERGVPTAIAGESGKERWFMLDRQPFMDGEKQVGWTFFARDIHSVFQGQFPSKAVKPAEQPKSSAIAMRLDLSFKVVGVGGDLYQELGLMPEDLQPFTDLAVKHKETLLKGDPLQTDLTFRDKAMRVLLAPKRNELGAIEKFEGKAITA